MMPCKIEREAAVRSYRAYSKDKEMEERVLEVP